MPVMATVPVATALVGKEANSRVSLSNLDTIDYPTKLTAPLFAYSNERSRRRKSFVPMQYRFVEPIACIPIGEQSCWHCKD